MIHQSDIERIWYSTVVANMIDTTRIDTDEGGSEMVYLEPGARVSELDTPTRHRPWL